MSSEKESQLREPSRHLTAADASRLFMVGLAQPRHPIDAVTERLGRPDAAAWFEAAIASVTGLPRTAWEPQAAPFPTLEDLKTAKDRAKTAMAEAANGAEASEATAAYFVTVAAALVRHGVLITRRPPGELAEPLTELATVAPDPWAELLEEAASRIGASERPSPEPGA
ncbi:MAG: hypothetical protein ACYS0G_02550 [Planctomycetota bacterium]|jgi:hypothetical protein